ncbi:alpha/beta hydrolase [Cytobacillus firmus]|uniref:alpha/beta hydrolase n=1 Tax=Cytobacillus firmus TaxID=1399 RepID=UPI0018CD69C5|nr:alpha/beta hydrolase [Cytobacillus firmus]MBG9587273.1 hypothetical protein [Cytobacillus firmus]
MAGKKILNITKLIIYILIFILLIGFIYEKQAEKQTLKKFPAPGEMVNLNGDILHVNIKGEGSPIVVIESGSGSWSIDWFKVQNTLSKYATVVTYDRAGYGWSSRSSKPRTGDQIVNDLHDLLRAKDLKGPIILVGHSLGGLYTRLYVQKFPDDISGVVLIDSTPIDFNSKLSQINPKSAHKFHKASEQNNNIAAFLSRFGVTRIIAKSLELNEFPTEIRELKSELAVQSKFYLTINEEINYTSQLKEKLQGKSFNDIPLTVITHSKPTDFTKFGFTGEENKTIEDHFQTMQRELSNLSNDSSFVIAKNSGHNIMFENPEIITKEIKKMIIKQKLK